MENVSVIRNYKDTVFRWIYKDRKELLALYNAINKAHYTNVEDLEVTTLDNAIYMHMKNDVSFLLDMRLQLYEQQSTINPNMPLRDLLYVAELYQKLVVTKDIYSRKLLKIPTPRFIVFYNGIEKQPERKELKLSEAFERPEKAPSLELRVLQLNINKGYNQELMDSCPMLFEYMCYVSKIRNYKKEMSLEKAIERAVNECIDEGILKNFLLENKAEVVRMSIYEYDEEMHKKTLREEGRLEMLVSQVCRKIKKGKSVTLIAEELEEDISIVEKIYNMAQKFAPGYDEEDIFGALNDSGDI